MSIKITRINEIAKKQPNTIFTSIYQVINYELLLECFKELDENKATGIDKVTKKIYENNLEENLNDLVKRLKKMVIDLVQLDKLKYRKQMEKCAS